MAKSAGHEFFRGLIAWFQVCDSYACSSLHHEAAMKDEYELPPLDVRRWVESSRGGWKRSWKLVLERAASIDAASTIDLMSAPEPSDRRTVTAHRREARTSPRILGCDAGDLRGDSHRQRFVAPARARPGVGDDPPGLVVARRGRDARGRVSRPLPEARGEGARVRACRRAGATLLPLRAGLDGSP